MPVDNGVRFDDGEYGAPARPESRKKNPDSAIHGRQPRHWRLALKNGDLVPKGQDLELSVSMVAEVDAER